MSGGLGVARIVVLAFGITLFAAGLATMALGGGAAFIGGFWLGATGLVLIVAALIERMRYRSVAADRTGDPAGRAGGEPPGTRLEPTIPAHRRGLRRSDIRPAHARLARPGERGPALRAGGMSAMACYPRPPGLLRRATPL